MAGFGVGDVLGAIGGAVGGLVDTATGGGTTYGDLGRRAGQSAGAAGFGVFPAFPSFPPTTPTVQQDTRPRLYCPTGSPNVLKGPPAGQGDPKWGTPLADALGLREGDPCPGAQQAAAPGFYCVPGTPTVLKGPPPGQGDPQWKPYLLAAALELKEGDACPGQQGQQCPTGQHSTRSGCVPDQQAGTGDVTIRQYCPPNRPDLTTVIEQAGPVGPEWGAPLSGLLGLHAGDPCPGTQAAQSACPTGYWMDDFCGRSAPRCTNIQSEACPNPGVAYGAPFPEDGMMDDLPMGAFGGGGPPDWFWMLWLIEHMNDADKSPARAAQDWAQDSRNPVGTRARTLDGGVVGPRYTSQAQPTYRPAATLVQGQLQTSGPAQRPTCPTGQMWSDANRRCQVPSTQPTFRALAPTMGQVTSGPTFGSMPGQAGTTSQVGGASSSTVSNLGTILRRGV